MIRSLRSLEGGFRLAAEETVAGASCEEFESASKWNEFQKSWNEAENITRTTYENHMNDLRLIWSCTYIVSIKIIWTVWEIMGVKYGYLNFLSWCQWSEETEQKLSLQARRARERRDGVATDDWEGDGVAVCPLKVFGGIEDGRLMTMRTKSSPGW